MITLATNLLQSRKCAEEVAGSVVATRLVKVLPVQLVLDTRHSDGEYILLFGRETLRQNTVVSTLGAEGGGGG